MEFELEEKEPRFDPEKYLAEKKAEIRKFALRSLCIGATILGINLFLVTLLTSFPETTGFSHRDFFSLLFRNIFFLIGVFFVLAGLWGFYEASRTKIEDLILTPEAEKFLTQVVRVRPTYTYIILVCIISVFFFQITDIIDAEGNLRSFFVAGLVKTDVIQKHEYWRILTSAFLHAGLLHVYFNSQAFYGFASLIEAFSDKARMAIVFLLSIIGGALASIVFLPEGISVGASGGIMGLMGYLAVYGFRRRQHLPPNFLRSIVVNIVFVLAFGIVAYRIIDNFAHIGGFLSGFLYGLMTVSRNVCENPRKVSALTEAAGMIAMGILVFFAILTILLITDYVRF
ncbi:MAG: rhomboid family intramembrane serine protease [Pyrinomonadaceae bacterium]|nr:rhomboid family intramembrane serine protease [Pyrinomonadaceae bacterium]MCX7639173.1 rhomboid family intramembrane serine protease [Pyrinomonadaceae bacterium]MDW8303606.1 rhomboid family intramembrane serine protease [Acidobacteriota bacterium]